MENASKALLMAGGVLLTMLVIALMLFAWSSLSDYYDEQDQLANIENVTEFNLQFTNYDRDDIHGYELISLVNKVADYNTRYSSADNNLSDAGYNPITVTIKLGDNIDKVRTNFSYDIDDSSAPYLLKSPTITQSQAIIIQSGVKSQITDIITTAGITETALGGSNVASKVAKSISKLDIEKLRKSSTYLSWEESTREERLKAQVLKEFNAVTGKKYTSYDQIKDWVEVSRTTDNSKTIKAYYEYYQFKKAIFKCTSIVYDNEDEDVDSNTVSGRVSKMEFEFTGKIE